MREVLTYTALGLLAITIVMVTQNLFRYLDEMISARVVWAEFGAIVGYLGLMLATYTVPIAFLFGVLLTFGRLSSDSEIIAMQSCGMGPPSLLRPVLILGIAASSLTAFLAVGVEHEAQLALRRVVKTMAVRGGFLEPGRFRHLGDRMLFIRNIDSSNRLEGVLISDRSDPERPLMIFAEHGRLHWNTERRELEFRLNNGDIHIAPTRDTRGDGGTDDSYRRISFLSFDYTLDSASLFGRHFSTLRHVRCRWPSSATSSRAPRRESLWNIFAERIPSRTKYKSIDASRCLSLHSSSRSRGDCLESNAGVALDPGER
jgi:lipopolysaccharide export LptBFGC system permease protein LptF